MPQVEVKILFVALLIGLAHVMSGIAVFITPEAMRVTPLASLSHIADSLGYLKGGFVAATLIGAGLMAIIGANIRSANRLWHALLFAPQQALLMLQLYTITIALAEGKYPDGYIPLGGAWFILADQSWAFLMAVSHSIWLTAFLYGGKLRGRSGGT